MSLDHEKVLELYPEYKKVLGPYTRPDGRKHIILNNTDKPKKDKDKLRTLSYPKALLETKLGRKLVDDETTDHTDTNKNNDEVSNLDVLSRSENARKAAINNKNCLGFKETEEQKRNGAKNGMSKFTEEEVIKYRSEYESDLKDKYQIAKETGVSLKSVENLLTRKTYTKVG